MNRALVVLDLLGEEATPENIEAWLASGGGEPNRLACGCVGQCDPFAHDTAPDWDGRHDIPNLCGRCGEEIDDCECEEVAE